MADVAVIGGGPAGLSAALFTGNPAATQSLADAGILDEKTGESMAQAARFRNVLAHTYGDVIAHNVVYNALQDLERYRDFLVRVRDYLDEISVL